MDKIIEQPRGLARLRHYWPWATAATTLLVILGWLLFGNHSATLRINADELTVNEVIKAEFKDYVRLSGQVVPIQVVQLSPEEGGIVTERVVEEGSPVRRGDVIVRLSNSALDLQILNAEAELAEKQNLLRNTQVAMQQDRLSNETERVQLDMDIQRRRRAWEQNERLYAEHLISREAWEQSREDYDLSRRKHSLVTQRLRQDSIYRSVQMEQMEDNLEAMRRNVVLVRERKQKLEVRSAIDGELGLLDVELGQSVAPGTKIGQINDLSDFKVQAMVDEHYIDRVRQGLPASFERDGHVYPLRLRKVYPEVRDGRFLTDFVFCGERPRQMRSGQTYYLNLELGRPEQAVLIPRGTFFQTTGGGWIFVLSSDGRTAHRRPIRIGRQNPQFYEVLEGLEEGERVITSGYEAFRDKEILKLSNIEK